MAIGDSRVTQSELQTIFFEAASITNERPLSVAGPKEDGSYVIINPNILMMGRSETAPPDDTDLCESLSYKDRYHIVKAITTSFWNLWAVQCAPKLVESKKWFTSAKYQLKVGDLVLVADKNQLKAKYKLAIVTDVKTSTDGNARSAELLYYAKGKGKRRGQAVQITRSVQRLAIILSVDEQVKPLCVIDNIQKMDVMEDEVADEPGDKEEDTTAGDKEIKISGIYEH